MGLFSRVSKADILKIERTMEDLVDANRIMRLAVKKFRQEMNLLRNQLRETRENLRDVQSFLSTPVPAQVEYVEEDLEEDDDVPRETLSKEEQRLALGRYVNGKNPTS